MNREETIFETISNSKLYAGDANYTSIKFVDPETGLSGSVNFDLRNEKIRGEVEVLHCEFDNGEQFELYQPPKKVEFKFEDSEKALDQLREALRNAKMDLKKHRNQNTRWFA